MSSGITYNFDEIYSLTNDYIYSKISETFNTTSPLHKEILNNKEYVDGGDLIRWAVAVKPNSLIKFISGTTADSIGLGTEENTKPCSVGWKFAVVPFQVTLQDLNATADSKHAIVSMMTHKAKIALASFKQFLAQSFYQSAVGNPLAFNGLADMFAPSGTAYAGLLDTDVPPDAAGDSVWLPQFNTTATTPNYATISPMITKLKTKAGFSMEGGKLDYMVSRADILSSFKATQQAQQRFMQAKELEAGFEGLMVDGVTWYGDDLAPAKKLYLINSKSIKLFHKYGIDKDSPHDVKELRIPNQPVTSNQKFISGNLAMVDRRVNGVFTNLAA